MGNFAGNKSQVENIALFFIERRTVDAKSGCWIWTGTKNEYGYGVIPNFAHRPPARFLAHRVSAFLFKGFGLYGKLCICHHCDNPACVNPDHLFIGTQADNRADCVKKGRSKGGSMPGESHPSAKLKEEDVFEVHRLHGEGLTYQEIASRFLVTKQLIWQIVKGRAWGHLCTS